jgi:hypothetical protein
VSFIKFYPFSLRAVHRPNVHRKNYKKIRLEPCPHTFWPCTFLSVILCVVEFVCICITCCWSPRVSAVHHLSSFVHTPHVFTILPTCFVFDKFSSFLCGTFRAPHLVIKKKGRKETTKERVKARCRITKKRKERNNKGKALIPFLIQVVQHLPGKQHLHIWCAQAF